MRKLLPLLLLLAACGKPVSSPQDPLGEAGGDAELFSGDDAALTDAATMGAALQVARAALGDGQAPPAGRLGTLPGRRAFVCAYGIPKRELCGTGVGKSLRGSIEAAARDLKAAGVEPQDGLRLKLDVVTKVHGGKEFAGDKLKLKRRSAATRGFWVQNEGQTSYVLPSELLERRIYIDHKSVRGVQRKALVKALKDRNDAFGTPPDPFGYTELRTEAWLEGWSGRPPVHLYRVHPADPGDLGPDALLAHIVKAADYLLSSIEYEGKDRGEIRYTFQVDKDRDTSGYNLLRHAGTTYSLLQAYDRTRYAPYLEASKAAFDYLFAHCEKDDRVGPRGPFGADAGEVLFVWSKKQKLVKLGGAGLALVAIDQYVEATGDTETYKEQARGFARFLVASQKEDGEFIYFPSRHPGGPPTSTDDGPYYPGEAILGLVRLYDWDPNPLWLETAEAGAKWLMEVRDSGKGVEKLGNDHWLMLGLSYLYHHTGRQEYLDHSLDLTRSTEYQMLKNKKRWKDYPDYYGSYYDPPNSTPAAVRGEGYGAVLDSCKIARMDCDFVEELLRKTVWHEALTIVDDRSAYWMKRPGRAFGGWMGGLLLMDIRNDFVQHNMSSLLGYERHLRAKTGETLPGGPGWMKKALAGETGWTGLPPERMTELLKDSRAWRKASPWEANR